MNNGLVTLLMFALGGLAAGKNGDEALAIAAYFAILQRAGING